MKCCARTMCAVLVLLAAIGGSARAQQNDKVAWKLLTPTLTGAPGTVVMLKVRVAIQDGWHMYTTMKYPDSAEAAPSPLDVTVGDSSLLTRAGQVKGTRPHVKFDEGFALNTEFWTDTATIIVPVRIARNARAGRTKGWVSFYFQTCNDKVCMPPSDMKLTFQVRVRRK